MKKLISATVALLVLNLASFGQIQISGGGTNKVIFSVLQDITFQVNPGKEASGYIWGVNIPNSLSSADDYNIDATLLSGSGPGGVLISSSANATVSATRLPTGTAAFTSNGMSLAFEFSEFKLVGGDTFTLRRGTYERPWAGDGIDPSYSYLYPPNTLTNPGTTYVITKNSFFSSAEQGAPLNTANITLIPEPSALSLLAVGLGGLAMVRRRRS